MSENSAQHTAVDEGSGRVIVLTGASGWIGQAVAELLAKQGHRLALLGRRRDALQKLADSVAHPGRHAPLPIVADLTNYDEIDSAVETIAHELGAPQVLINNAGGWSGSRFGPFLDKSAADLRTELDNNLLTTVLVTRAVLPSMVEGNYGRIVNVSSIAGLVALDGHSAYSAAKAGHSGLARQLAVEFGPFGITTNCVAPGAVLTGRAADLVAAGDDGIMTMLRMTPSTRLTTPEEVAELVSFLASDRAGQINGQTIAIDGGMTSA
jgi:NAD(P)-dependent dehydrogenase (short-subunit alcohol dehydrogenase family)